MKKQILAGLLAATALISTQAFAIDTSKITAADLTDLTSATVSSGIQLKINKNSPVAIELAKVDPANASVLDFYADGEGKNLLARANFHNSPEADWLLQFLKQADPEVKVIISVKVPNPANPAATMVDSFSVIGQSLSKENPSQTQIVILAKEQARPVDKSNKPTNGKIILDCPQDGGMRTLVLTLSDIAGDGKDLDGFTDLFRFKLEKQGLWYGDEGVKDHKNKPGVCGK